MTMPTSRRRPPRSEGLLDRLLGFRRLTIRYERDADLHLALLRFGCALICFNLLRLTFREAL